MTTGFADNAGTSIYFESFGNPADPTLLLVGGLGMQATGYSPEFVDAFVHHGLHVVRYDNRDVGLSADFSESPAVGKRGNRYELTDMAADGMAVLDAVGVPRAHVFGISMGGMIVQTMAIHHPLRIATMTSVMSSTGERGVGQPTPAAFALLTSPPEPSRAGAIASALDGARTWGSPEFIDEERVAANSGAAFDRAFRPDGVVRQYAAIMAAGARRAAELPALTVPALVIHGTADTLIDVSGGRRTAELIPGAQLEIIDGMGHDLPPQLMARIVGLVATFVGAHPIDAHPIDA